MFGIYGVNGPLYLGPLEEMPQIRQVGAERPVQPIGTGGNELGDMASRLPTPEAIEAYRREQAADKVRGPLVNARQIMQSSVISVRADDDVVHALRVLTQERIHQAPVLDESKAIVGIVSERDLLTALNPALNATLGQPFNPTTPEIDHEHVKTTLARNVADVMSTPVVTAAPETDIRRIAQVMVERDVNGIPIVNERQHLIGFISRGNLLRAIVTDPPLSLWR